MRLASIVGARPQLVKVAVVSRALRQRHEEVIIHTGQHYDNNMSAQFFDELDIPAPDYHLGIGSGSHGAQTGRMLEAIEEVLVKERFDAVIVYGDTNSTLAGALAAAKLHIPVAHVEAGLRNFDQSMPEEINRVLSDHLSSRLFCPTATARRNLNNEGITQGVELVGDVMYDLLLQVQPELAMRTEKLLQTLRLAPQSYVLVTVHRAVNADNAEAMRGIADGLNRLEMPVIFPVHPRTRARLEHYDITWKKHVHLMEPVGYLDMMALARTAYRILTDSGGLQKEAFLLGVPCVTLREETEWIETVEVGWNVLVGARWQDIVKAVARPRPEPPGHNPFGEGDAAVRIAHSWSDRKQN
ncbi:MAG: UDP-N-acetylglucosamine 2-epimerase (non-hydrolyzing) [Chloroflexi bacterium]|nr:MAG: UDP-N-acetylglucosamine 2-epimerase (non-hydrolyzing) [Chloroflexota bacterium]